MLFILVLFFKCHCVLCPLVLFVFQIFLLFCAKIKNFYNDLNSYLCFSSPIYYNRKVSLFWINVIHPCVVLQLSLCHLSTSPLCLSNIFILLCKIKNFLLWSKWLLMFFKPNLLQQKGSSFLDKCHSFLCCSSNDIVYFVQLSSLSFKYFYYFAPKLRIFIMI